eukprot:CAMPEP_0197195318 /NCGR_PEP_ID=MMETSP1423-20130617/30868_1 /TAXON_ID=476441 /ORGANISM="Pseudo-nitzschia heimii, Strain UNC1101" /LENGTH=240 /DNA_ID=CAMNT_0042648917 /DNA_START=21 /DNA_END=740 /DNA_ORIENTATION=+
MNEVERDVLRDKAFLDKGVFGHVWLVELVGGPSELLKLDSHDSQDFDYHAECQRKNPTFALKSINVNASNPEDAALQLTNEARILSELDHENIIRLRGVGSETFSGCFRSRDFFLLLDVLDETLEDRLETWNKQKTKTLGKTFRKLMSNDSNHRLRECQRMHRRIRDSAIGIARGLEYLHLNKVVWCDVKPANIGFRADAVKLIDFGMASKLDDCGDDESRGSLRYMSPEVMNGQRYTLE